MNLYGFIGNDPSNSIDLFGLVVGESTLDYLTLEQLLELGVLIGAAETLPLVKNPPKLSDIPLPKPSVDTKTEPEPKTEPETKPEPKPKGPDCPPHPPKKDEPNGCLPCNPPERHFVYQIAYGTDRSNGAHAPTPTNPNGINQVKYWRMTQVPYSETEPKACKCYLKWDHSDPNTLVPMPGEKNHPSPAGVYNPPPYYEGPMLGGGKIRP